MDFVSKLPLELSAHIIVYVARKGEEQGNCLKTLSEIGLVCHNWRKIVLYDSLWRELLQYPSMQRPSFCRNLASLVPNAKAAMQELVLLGRDLQIPIIYQVREASSQDHSSQGIEQTLSSNPHTFWSSQGSLDSGSEEWLDFQLISPLCFISSIDITPYLAPYQRGLPCYAPSFVSFSVFLNSSSNAVYRSSLFSIVNRPLKQRFNFQSLVAGGFVRIQLHGHASNQPGDYYTTLPCRIFRFSVYLSMPLSRIQFSIKLYSALVMRQRKNQKHWTR